VLADDVASHVIPKGPPLNAMAMMAVVCPKAAPQGRIPQQLTHDITLISVVGVMVSCEDRSQK